MFCIMPVVLAVIYGIITFSLQLIVNIYRFLDGFLVPDELHSDEDSAAETSDPSELLASYNGHEPERQRKTRKSKGGTEMTTSQIIFDTNYLSEADIHKWRREASRKTRKSKVSFLDDPVLMKTTSARRLDIKLNQPSSSVNDKRPRAVPVPVPPAVPARIPECVVPTQRSFQTGTPKVRYMNSGKAYIWFRTVYRNVLEHGRTDLLLNQGGLPHEFAFILCRGWIDIKEVTAWADARHMIGQGLLDLVEQKKRGEKWEQTESDVRMTDSELQEFTESWMTMERTSSELRPYSWSRDREDRKRYGPFGSKLASLATPARLEEILTQLIHEELDAENSKLPERLRNIFGLLEKRKEAEKEPAKVDIADVPDHHEKEPAATYEAEDEMVKVPTVDLKREESPQVISESEAPAEINCAPHVTESAEQMGESEVPEKPENISRDSESPQETKEGDADRESEDNSCSPESHVMSAKEAPGEADEGPASVEHLEAENVQPQQDIASCVTPPEEKPVDDPVIVMENPSIRAEVVQRGEEENDSDDDLYLEEVTIPSKDLEKTTTQEADSNGDSRHSAERVEIQATELPPTMEQNIQNVRTSDQESHECDGGIKEVEDNSKDVATPQTTGEPETTETMGEAQLTSKIARLEKERDQMVSQVDEVLDWETESEPEEVAELAEATSHVENPSGSLENSEYQKEPNTEGPSEERSAGILQGDVERAQEEQRCAEGESSESNEGAKPAETASSDFSDDDLPDGLTEEEKAFFEEQMPVAEAYLKSQAGQSAESERGSNEVESKSNEALPQLETNGKREQEGIIEAKNSNDLDDFAKELEEQLNLERKGNEAVSQPEGNGEQEQIVASVTDADIAMFNECVAAYEAQQHNGREPKSGGNDYVALDILVNTQKSAPESDNADHDKPMGAEVKWTANESEQEMLDTLISILGAQRDCEPDSSGINRMAQDTPMQAQASVPEPDVKVDNENIDKVMGTEGIGTMTDSDKEMFNEFITNLEAQLACEPGSCNNDPAVQNVPTQIQVSVPEVNVRVDDANLDKLIGSVDFGTSEYIACQENDEEMHDVPIHEFDMDPVSKTNDFSQLLQSEAWVSGTPARPAVGAAAPGLEEEVMDVASLVAQLTTPLIQIGWVPESVPVATQGVAPLPMNAPFQVQEQKAPEIDLVSLVSGSTTISSAQARPAANVTNQSPTAAPANIPASSTVANASPSPLGVTSPPVSSGFALPPIAEPSSSTNTPAPTSLSMASSAVFPTSTELASSSAGPSSTPGPSESSVAGSSIRTATPASNGNDLPDRVSDEDKENAVPSKPSSAGVSSQPPVQTGSVSVPRARISDAPRAQKYKNPSSAANALIASILKEKGIKKSE